MTAPDVTHLVTRLLRDASAGRDGALDEVFPVVYAELQRLAKKVRADGAGDTLATTDLVHEAYLRLVRSDGLEWADRQHFFRVAARAMRQVIVRDAERRHRIKRGGRARAVTFHEEFHGGAPTDEEVLALHEALGTLAVLDERQATIVELRFFAGLTIDEAAEVVGVSAATANRDWVTARVWIARELAR